MAPSLFSTSWYRVASLRPVLRNHVQIHRHQMRHKTWFVVQDRQSGRFFRVSPEAYMVLDRLDGRRTISEIWEDTGRLLGNDQPTQDEIIQLLAQLYRSDLIRGDIPPDLTELVYRSQTMANRARLARIKNPLALRFPMIDPDRFLERTVGVVRLLFTSFGAVVWLAVVASAIVLAALHWDQLTENLSDRVLSLQNVALLLVLYPLIKAIHELGHAYALKVWGGEVHEMGVMLLVLMPVPYVDASASSAFRSRWRRAAVGGAGIMIEMLLASLALFIWINAEPGLVRAAAFNVMLIGGVSTVLFNGNPLLRFDGYYVLCDLLDIANLGTRSNRYLAYLTRRYGFSDDDVQSPVESDGEAFWFFCYGIGAFAYRIFIAVVISLFIASKFFFIGVLLAIFAAVNAIVLPAYKGFKYVFFSNDLGPAQPRARKVTLGVLAIAGVVLFGVPAPNATTVEGVVWASEPERVVNGADGFVAAILAKSGDMVAANQILLKLDDPALAARITSLEIERREFKASFDAVNLIDQVQAEILSEQLRRTKATLAFFQSQREKLVIKAAAAGEFVLPAASDLPGRFVTKGQLLGHVLENGSRSIRVLVPQSRVDDVRHDVEAVDVRFASALDQVIGAQIAREVPSALTVLPSPLLAASGGGNIATDPTDPSGLKPIAQYYQFDLLTSAQAHRTVVGERVYARIRHSDKPIGIQWLIVLRQVFLSHFNV